MSMYKFQSTDIDIYMFALRRRGPLCTESNRGHRAVEVPIEASPSAPAFTRRS